MRSANAVDELARRLDERLGADRVLRPGAPAYASATTLWNGAVTTRPALVVRPHSSAEVAAALTAARESGTTMSVRGGGHDWAGRALRDGGLVIDLNAMRAVRIEHDIAVAAGGSLANDVVAAAAPHGRTVATGTAGVVGMAGLTLGGGYGPLLGSAGLAADNLLGADVVLADGQLVTTDDDPELLWALRGGGGNFGVVTEMRIRTHADLGLVGGIILFPWHEAATVLARYAELIANAPDELTVLLELSVVPDVGPCLLAVPVWSGARQDADNTIAEVLRLGTPITSTVGPATQQDLLGQFDQAVPTGMHWDLRTRTIATLTPAIVDLVVRFAEARPGPRTGIGLRPFHGAATRIGADDTAFGLRARHIVVEISAGHHPHENASTYRKWVDDVRTALEPHALPGGYPNFLLPDQHDQVAHAYGTHAARLIAAKERYDPGHVFDATPLPRAT
jgi:hypothetical protein